VVHPLNSLLQKDIKLEWTGECQAAWDAVIHAIAHTRGVYYPDYAHAFHLRVDACKMGIGAYLFQKIPNVTDNTIEERVVEYYSRSVPKSKRC